MSVEDPPSELVNPFPQQTSTGTPFSELDQNQKSLLQETSNRNFPWLNPDRADDQSDQRFPSDLSSNIFEDRPGMSHTAKGLSKQKKLKLAKEGDSQSQSHDHSSIPSSQSTEAAEQHLKDVARLEAKNVLWSQTASECGILPYDDGAKREDGGSGLAGVTLGNGRREKVWGPMGSMRGTCCYITTMSRLAFHHYKWSVTPQLAAAVINKQMSVFNQQTVQK